MGGLVRARVYEIGRWQERGREIDMGLNIMHLSVFERDIGSEDSTWRQTGFGTKGGLVGARGCPTSFKTIQ